MKTWLRVTNGTVVEQAKVPSLPFATFAGDISTATNSGARLVALFAKPRADGGAILFAVVAVEADGALFAACSEVGASYSALTPNCPQAHLFERDIFETCGVRPEGHPWLKPVRFPASGRRQTSATTPPCGVMDFYRVAGDEIHEVAVGPVHAGIIEPGHFRFQCHGEIVHHLEISLGFQHRGIERALLGGPHPRTIHHMETLAGDTTVGHATAYSRIVESLGHLRVPARAQALRGVAQELERLACHIGDLGALAGDVGFLPTQSYCGRIRGDALNLTAVLCGNRFSRGLVVPGGTAQDVGDAEIADLLARNATLRRDATSAIELLFGAPSVMARFEGVGVVPTDVCHALGLVGVAARASGVARDVRNDFPYGFFRFSHLPICTWDTNDVFARAYVRWLEIQQSLAFVADQLHALPGGAVRGESTAVTLTPNSFVVTLVEGWRGEIVHAAITDAGGHFALYKVFDPSFHNWAGLAYALRDAQISDFPLCNKSFNLSYCGHDL
jgi:Ni,Fe-hydrogenase III large subunit